MIKAPERLHFSPACFLQDVAALIAARHRDALPDWSFLQIAITPRAIGPMREALISAARQCGTATLLLPRMGTLIELAAREGYSPVPMPTLVTESEKVLAVVDALRQRKWFSPSETMAISRELVQLADELTQQLVALPASLEEHRHQLARAYAFSASNRHFNLEAQLTYEIWRTLSSPAAEKADLAAQQALQLANWCNRLAHAGNNAALYVVGTTHYRKRERAFFEACASACPVALIDQTLPGDVPSNPREAFVGSALADAPAPRKSGKFEVVDPQAGVADGLYCYQAVEVEDEAQAALATLKQWLLQGKRRIAVVALDRLAARRLWALAERDAILMSDEIGWPLSTTPGATAVLRWLEAGRDGCYFATLLDLMKSPALFADLQVNWGRERVRAAVLAVEQVIRAKNIVSGLEAMRHAVDLAKSSAIAPPSLADGLHLLDRLDASWRSIGSARRSAAKWLEALEHALQSLGLRDGLGRDAAGSALLACLQGLSSELAGSAVKISASDWIDWLRHAFEQTRYRDESVSSPVVLTSLSATRFRTFDAVILLGASVGNLPGKPIGTGIFNQSVRATLGLSTVADELNHITEDLYGLLCRSESAWISWQRHSERDPGSSAPWIAALQLAAQRSGRTLQVTRPAADRPATDSAARVAPEDSFISDSPPLTEQERPRPRLQTPQVPERISASGYQSLIDCPYQYFARAVLKLRGPDEIEEDMQKRDFGEHVHAILNRFHRRVPHLTGNDLASLRALLLQETQSVFAQAVDQSFTVHAWRLQWESAIDAYLDWQLEREAQGWRWAAGESAGSVSIAVSEERKLLLEGRIDRIDRIENADPSPSVSLIDYKARSATALKARLEVPGEDVQLPVYATLVKGIMPNAAVTDAAYLSIDRNRVIAINVENVSPLAQQNLQRLTELFDAMHGGAALPAQGVVSVCQHCEMEGLCRRGHWAEGAWGDPVMEKGRRP